MHFEGKQCMYIKDEEKNGKIDLEYNPIDYSFIDIPVLTIWNLQDKLPKSIRKYGNF